LLLPLLLFVLLLLLLLRLLIIGSILMDVIIRSHFSSRLWGAEA